MAEHKNWPKIAVVGAGAVGGYFGALLAKAGAPVVMIGRKPFADAVESSGLLLDSIHFQANIQVKASTELSAVRGAELILFCVKTINNAVTARELAPFLDARATVISLQNGVDNVEQIRAAGNFDAVPAVVYVAASVPKPGQVKHVGRGDLIIGPANERTNAIAEIFGRAAIPCRVSGNIDGELWTKLIWNCALNAISALGQARYGRIAASADARMLMQTIVDEVLAVARAAGIVLPGFAGRASVIEGANRVATQMADAWSSTAQDIQRGRRTEIDSLNGYIARRGAELGVPTPVNQALYTLIKLLEAIDLK